MRTINAKQNDKEYVFKVKVLLGDFVYFIGRRGKYKEKVLNSEKLPWRRIAILGEQSLYKFAEVIVSSFDFDFDHCFGFFSNTENYYYSDSEKKYELFADLEDQGIEPVDSDSVKKTKINKVWEKIGERMIFMFDYGDDWRFLVKLEGINPAKKDQKYPVILEKKGKSPEQYPLADDF
ncbi:MAG: hypothetical protein WC737_05410 [Parcubacteria group bacterium]